MGEGEGSFYGPKIDLHASDSLGRSWQLGTIQLDAQMPARFGLTYMGADNREHPVFVVHRALYGSFERFIGLLLEHYAGVPSAWLAPVQVRVVPVAETHHAAADELVAALRASDLRVEIDARAETLAKRIRDAELQKVPYVVVWGDRETREAMAVRRRGGGRLDAFSRGACRDRRAVAAAQLKDRPADFCLQTRVGLLCSLPAKQERHRPSPRRLRAARGSTESVPTRECRRCMQWRFHEEGGSTRLGELP